MIDLSNNTNPYRMSFRAYWSYIKAGDIRMIIFKK